MKLVRQPMVFQPIVHHASGHSAIVIGFEALWKPEHTTPVAAFRVQRKNGTLVAADLSCMGSGWQQRPPLDNQLLFLNVFPETLDAPEFWEWVEILPEQAPVVWELVELPWTPTTVKNLNRLRERGFKIAFDDVGQHADTWTSLRHFDPDIVKLDARLAHRTARTKHTLESLLVFARIRAIQVIVEGIEASDQAQWLQSLGITHFQGYYYGRPAPAFVKISAQR